MPVLNEDQIAEIRQRSSKQFYGPIEIIPGRPIHDLLDTLDAKDERIKELEEALGFYGDTQNWIPGKPYTTTDDEGAEWTWWPIAGITDDNGQRARNVLREKGDGK